MLRWVFVSLALLAAPVFGQSKPSVGATEAAASAAFAASAAKPASAASEPKAAAQAASAASGAKGAAPAASAPAEPLAASLTLLTQSLSTYLLALAGTSALVVALLEAYKKLFSVRGKYHRTAVMRWLAQDSASIKGALSVAKPGILSAVALGGGGHYDVPGSRAAHETKSGDDCNPEKAYAEFFHLTSGQALPKEPKPSHAVMRWRGVDS